MALIGIEKSPPLSYPRLGLSAVPQSHQGTWYFISLKKGQLEEVGSQGDGPRVKMMLRQNKPAKAVK